MQVSFCSQITLICVTKKKSNAPHNFVLVLVIRSARVNISSLICSSLFEKKLDQSPIIAISETLVEEERVKNLRDSKEMEIKRREGKTSQVRPKRGGGIINRCLKR